MSSSLLLKYDKIEQKVLNEFQYCENENEIKSIIKSLLKKADNISVFNVRFFPSKNPRKYDVCKLSDEGHTYFLDFCENYDSISIKVIDSLNAILSDLLVETLIIANKKIVCQSYYKLDFKFMIGNYIAFTIEEN